VEPPEERRSKMTSNQSVWSMNCTRSIAQARAGEHVPPLRARTMAHDTAKATNSTERAQT
jgi:hypothetical protein